MNSFLTLVRRDVADYRGGLIITPIVIAIIMFILGVLGTITGTSQFGVDKEGFMYNKDRAATTFEDEDGTKHKIHRDEKGRIIIDTDKKRRNLHSALDDGDREEIGGVLAVGTGIAAVLPIGVAALVILFALAGALYEERKDRTILFWKSMPVSDLSNAGAKMVSIIGGGFAVALGVSILLQIGFIGLAMAGMTGVGVTGLPVADIFGNAAMLWLVTIVALLTYIGWALPVYAWFLAVSAAAPKAPFVLAIVPLVLGPAIAAVMRLPGDAHFWLAPLKRLIGWQAFDNVSSGGIDKLVENESGVSLHQTLTEITSSMASPSFWIGLVLAAALIYAASEIRRRRAL